MNVCNITFVSVYQKKRLFFVRLKNFQAGFSEAFFKDKKFSNNKNMLSGNLFKIL